MKFIVRIDMPDHPINRLRDPHWIYGSEYTQLTANRPNAEKFDTEDDARAAGNKFLTCWKARRPEQTYIATVEDAPGYRIRWVVKTWWGGPNREMATATTRGRLGTGGGSTARLVAALEFATREEAETAARVWVSRALSNPGAKAVARRLPL